MSNVTDWARADIEQARATIGSDPQRDADLDEALAILLEMIERPNTREAVDACGHPTLCFYFPDTDDPRMLAINDILTTAGWVRVQSDMGIAMPIEFERRIPPHAR